MSKTRVETDSMGQVEVPAERYFGAQTQRSIEHFAIGQARMPLAVIYALAQIKRAAAQVHARSGALPQNMAEAIAKAAAEVIEGKFDGDFPLSVYQTGSGTQSNMNVNEVIANRASELLGGTRGQERMVHPNDHVNRAQSSNDTFPTAMAIASVSALENRLLPALANFQKALDDKAREWMDIIKLGRTHFMDAVPIALGQEVSGWADQIQGVQRELLLLLPGLTELPIGGTAVGTGLNAPADFSQTMCQELSALLGRSYQPCENRFAGLAAHDRLVSAHGVVRTAAAAINKIANDIRVLASGPRGGLGELTLPANEPGSSIMPGKVNPTQCEMVNMVFARVLGNDVTIGMAGAGGVLELNTYKPVIISTFLESVELLADAADSFTRNAVQGLAANRSRIKHFLDRSLMLVTALVPKVGYDRAAEIAHHAEVGDLTLKEAAVALGALTADEYDQLVRPEAMVGPVSPNPNRAGE